MRGSRAFFFSLLAAAPLYLVQAGAALAQNPSRELPEAFFGTLYVRHETSTVAGRIAACNLHFNVFARDFIYRKGEPFVLSGTLGLFRGSTGDVNGFTEASLLDRDAPAEDFARSAPASVRLVAPLQQSADDGFLSSSRSSGGEYLYSLFKPDRFTEIMTDALRSDTKEVRILVARKSGSLDIAVLLKLDVISSDRQGKRTHGPGELLSFWNCMQNGF